MDLAATQLLRGKLSTSCVEAEVLGTNRSKETGLELPVYPKH